MLIRFFSDLYTFDADEASSYKTYEKIIKTYENILERLGLTNNYVQGKA